MASKMYNAEEASSSSSSRASDGHGKQKARISKPSMFMVLALWMERSPLAVSPSESSEDETDPLHEVKKVGVVFVLPNDRALSVTCSQGGVHGSVIPLNQFGQERVKNCEVYLSRRPCSFCTKLLVQAGIRKVYYLPTEPEVNVEEDVKVVDNIFINAAAGLSPFVPDVDMTVITEQKHQQSPYSKHRDERAVQEFRQKLKEDHWCDDWIVRASEMLESPFFNDQGCKEGMMKNMENLFEWMARTTIGDVPDNIEFAEVIENLEIKPLKKPCNEQPLESNEEAPGCKITPSIPTPCDPAWQQHALHMSRMAQMLSQRSDDPIRGVGCVLMLNNEVISIGWNGFPAKALYGEFPRSACKEPYVIHAEQNALLTKNANNLDPPVPPKDILEVASSVLYVSKVPCKDCVLLLVQAGVRHFVFPTISESEEEDGNIVLKKMVQEKKCRCYTSKEKAIQSPAHVQKAAKKMSF